MSNVARFRVQDSDFDCEVCTNMVEQALQSERGIEQLTVEDNGGIEIAYDADRISPETLKRIIEDQGYSVR